MAEDRELPFAAYLRQMDSLVRDLPPAQRAAIQRELHAHLLDAADEQGGDPNDPHLQQIVIAALGPSHLLAAQFGRVHGGVERVFRRMAFACGLLGGVLGMLLAPFAAETIAPAGLCALPLLLACIAVGGLGIRGVLLREQHRPGGTWRVAFATTALLAGGFQVFYKGNGSLDVPAGLGLLLAGELLLCNLAVSAPILALPRVQRGLALALALLLVSGVAPCSYLPNPLGLAYLIAGSYTYQPDLPFINGFATLGVDPSTVVRERLDGLIGQTGLDPLDPVQPLIRYTITRVTVSTFGSPSTVAVDLHYADGRARSYRVPVVQYGHNPAVVLSSLDRFFAKHRPLGMIAFAGDTAPIRLGVPVRLPLAEAAQHLGMTDLFAGEGTPDALLNWAPDGRRVLLHKPSTGTDADGFWLITLDGAPPRKLAGEVARAIWSGDGQQVVVVTPSRVIVTLDLAHNVQHTLGIADDGQVTVFDADVYYTHDSTLWRQPLDGQTATRLLLPEATGAPTFSPDGQRAAYHCAAAMCLADRDGTHVVRLSLPFSATAAFQETVMPGPAPTALPANRQPSAPPYPDAFGLAWSPDGQTLAISTSSYPQGTENAPAQLWLIARNGREMRTITIAPDGLTAPPQWAVNGRFVLVNTFPEGGRRVIAVAAHDGTVRDLSQPRWDAFARVTPDMQQVLLWNGRGGFWVAPLVIHP